MPIFIKILHYLRISLVSLFYFPLPRYILRIFPALWQTSKHSKNLISFDALKANPIRKHSFVRLPLSHYSMLLIFVDCYN